jgi:hypothetical protein
MRRLRAPLLLLLISCITKLSYSQRECGSPFNRAEIQVNDPEQYNRFLQHEQHVNDYKTLSSSNSRLIN